MSREPTGYSQSEDDGYDAVVLVCPREGCNATNVSISGDQAVCGFCGYQSNLEKFIPETKDEESYHGY